MVHDYKGKYIPVLIDYSHTNPSSHCIVDHVTLETDLIINEVDINDINFLLSNLIYPPEKILATNSKMKRSKTQQIICIINKLRIDAFDKYKMSEIEYIGAAFLKTLQLLSHADFPDENVTKAHIYINHLLKRINLL